MRIASFIKIIAQLFVMFIELPVGSPEHSLQCPYSRPNPANPRLDQMQDIKELDGYPLKITSLWNKFFLFPWVLSKYCLQWAGLSHSSSILRSADI
jgi:hypothetical protein